MFFLFFSSAREVIFHPLMLYAFFIILLLSSFFRLHTHFSDESFQLCYKNSITTCCARPYHRVTVHMSEFLFIFEYPFTCFFLLCITFFFTRSAKNITITRHISHHRAFDPKMSTFNRYNFQSETIVDTLSRYREKVSACKGWRKGARGRERSILH